MEVNPGPIYPKDKFSLTRIKNMGCFILFDRNAEDVSIILGGNINELLTANNNLVFSFGSEHPTVTNIAGTPEYLEESLVTAGFSEREINTILSSGITSDNIATPEAQRWIDIFREKNKSVDIIAANYNLNHIDDLYSRFLDNIDYVGSTNEGDDTEWVTLTKIYFDFKNWFHDNFPGRCPKRIDLENELALHWGPLVNRLGHPFNGGWYSIRSKNANTL